MARENPIKTGASGVFVTIADASNKPILDPVSGMPLGELIISFSYLYDEEDDDECKITLGCEGPEIVDLPQLKEQRYLLVQWGYRDSNGVLTPSPVRKVMIRDTHLRGNENNITLVIECTDGFSLMKTAAMKKREDDNLLEWIKENLSGNYRIRHQIIDAKQTKGSDTSFLERYFSMPVYSSVTGGIMPGSVYWNALVVPEMGVLEQDPDVLVKHRLQVGVGKTPYTAIKDLLKTKPGGPYHLNSRDDGITVRPTNFNQPSIATFEWRGEIGGMISFDIKTRKKRKTIDIQIKSKIDPLTKNTEGSVTQNDATVPDLSYDAITGAAIRPDMYSDLETTKATYAKDESLLKQNATQYLNEYVRRYNETKDDPQARALLNLEPLKVKVKAKVREQVDLGPTDKIPGWASAMGFGSFKSARRGFGWRDLQRDKSVIILSKPDGSKYGFWENPEVLTEKEFEVELQPSDLLAHAGDLDSANARAMNDINDSMQKQLECDMKSMGLPFMESSKIITLDNVSEKYSGDWYIKSVEHRIDPSGGYICDYSLIKKTISNGTITQSTVSSSNVSFSAKIQNIAKEQLDPVTLAKSQAFKSQVEELYLKYSDAGEIIVVTDNYEIIGVYVDQDWVSLNRLTQTDNINNQDQILNQSIR